MSSDKTVIAEHKNRENLIPVMTYVYGLSRPRTISAMLRFLSLCHEDCGRNARLANVLSEEDEALCASLLDGAMYAFLKVANPPRAVQARMAGLVYTILKKSSVENLNFLRDRFIALCGDHTYQAYWKKFEKASSAKDISRFMDQTRGAMQRKQFADFTIFFLALAIFYGCGDAFYERIALLEKKLKMKFGNGFLFDRLGLYLWPLDFSFMQDGNDTGENCDEHGALLHAVKSINPDVRVQVCVDSHLWSRDVIAWLSDDFDFYAKSGLNDDYCRFGRGMLYEGGNIVPGTALEKFVLVARGPLSDDATSLDFHYAMFNRNIRIYTLPDGFLWSRDPETEKDYVLDSIHIDSVINVVPASCTIDNRPKIIVDPYYYALIREDAEFARFLSEQRIPGADVVIVDERELCLNLPNFSVLFGTDGEPKLLFNKDKGHTLPRLKLRADLVVQPAIEITKMASCYGSIRCATNMLPSSYVKNDCPLNIKVSNGFLPETNKMIKDQLQKGKPNALILSKLWVSRIFVRIDQKENTWEFDEFSRTMYLSVSPDGAADLVECCRAVNDLVADFGEKQSQCLGINLNEEDRVG